MDSTGRPAAVAAPPASLADALAALEVAIAVVGPDDEPVGTPSAPTSFPIRLSGRAIWDALPDPARESLRKALRETRQTGRRATTRLTIPARAGPVALDATTALLDGGLVAIHFSEAAGRPDDAGLLRTREDERQRLLDASPTILYHVAVRPGGVVEPVDVSENVTRLLGYTREECLVAGWWAGSIHPDDLSAALAGVGELIRNGQHVHEYRFRHRDGGWRLIRDAMWLERRADGRPAEILGAWSDVTAQRRAEERLREREARLRAILIAVPDCIKVIGPDGWLEELNPAGLAMIEARSLEEACRRPLADYLEPEDRELLPNLHARVMKGGLGTVQARIRGLKGTKRTVECRGVPLRDASGRVIAMLAVSRDITDRERAEQELRLGRARLEVAVATAGLAVWELDIQTDTAVWDARTFELYNRDPALGPPAWDEFTRLIHQDDLPALLQAHQRVCAGQRVYAEYRTHPGNGPVRHLAVACQRVDDAHQGRSYLVGTLADRTRERELEEQFRQAQKLESIGRLAGGIAHDFNNLLTAILGHAELLEGDVGADEALAGHVRGIRKSGERARDLTRQLLAFARRQVVAPRIVDLSVLLTESQSMLRRLVGEDVELVLDTREALWPVLADPGQIEQIVLNLAVNARDAMPKGGRLTLCTANVTLTEADTARHPGLAPGPHVLLSVTDTGTGMTADVLAHIFEPFFTTKPAGVGTGLGLATVYGVVHQSGGHIRVTSERGEGTSFEIFLPRADPASVPAPASEPQPRPAAGPATETVLLVEDDGSVRELVHTALVQAGYTVLTAGEPRRAIEIADEHPGPIDLLVTDVVMPAMNGLELAGRLGERRVGLKILFVSGYPGDTLARHGLEEEGRAFLAKPFTLARLLERVREVLDGIIHPS